jgi:hypothetical protein
MSYDSRPLINGEHVLFRSQFDGDNGTMTKVAREIRTDSISIGMVFHSGVTHVSYFVAVAQKMRELECVGVGGFDTKFDCLQF